MHILRYFIVVGSALLGLLFYANANLEPRWPLAIMTDFHGLPKPWHGPAFPRIAETDIPASDIAPDINTKPRLIAAPPTAKQAVPAAALKTFAMTRQATPSSASTRKNRVVRKHVPYDHQKSRYAWQNRNSGAFASDRF